MIKKDKKGRDEVFFNFGQNVQKDNQRKVKNMKQRFVEKDIDLEDLKNLSTSECLDLCTELEE